VDLDDAGRSRKWRVENSWSDTPGDKGFFQMSDPWFDEFNYEVVVHKKYVPESVLAALKKKPVELDPWDPMGSLA
jgi:bleomycin hydrolase